MLRTRGPRKWPIEVSIDIGRPSRERASATPPQARWRCPTTRLPVPPGTQPATVLGSNPKKQLDEDLLRMKSLLETGKEPYDAAVRRPTRAKS
jgi:hypothetical protein